MKSFSGLFGVLCFVVFGVSYSRDVEGSSQRRRKSTDAALLEEWILSMVPEVDYNGSYQWRRSFRSRSASDFFHGYNERLSKMALAKDATVYFASIGACDGTTDQTIKTQFLRYSHWNGVFVEPVSNNIVDLVAYLDSNGATNRSLVIQAAATSKCVTPTIEVERPLYEEKNKSTPHWLRRQIGSILPGNRNDARPGWIKEQVRCVTANDILVDWGAATSLQLRGSRKRRPHVLKIDVEGHDYAVLMGFLLDSTLVRDLPLLIEFEAKSISKLFPAARKRMERIGYIVADYGQDGFALLRGDMVYVPRSSINGHLTRDLTVGNVVEAQLAGE